MHVASIPAPFGRKSTSSGMAHILRLRCENVSGSTRNSSLSSMFTAAARPLSSEPNDAGHLAHLQRVNDPAFSVQADEPACVGPVPRQQGDEHVPARSFVACMGAQESSSTPAIARSLSTLHTAGRVMQHSSSVWFEFHGIEEPGSLTHPPPEGSSLSSAHRLSLSTAYEHAVPAYAHVGGRRSHEYGHEPFPFFRHTTPTQFANEQDT